MNTAPWVIEGCDHLSTAAHRHKDLFYTQLKATNSTQDATHSKLFDKGKFLKILEFSKLVRDGNDCRTLFVTGYQQAYLWVKEFEVIVCESSEVLVKKPKNSAVVVSLDKLLKVTYRIMKKCFLISYPYMAMITAKDAHSFA